MGIVNPIHLAFVALVALVVLGPKKFPDMARALGHGVREFRQALSLASLNDPPPPIPTHNGMFTPDGQPGMMAQPGVAPMGETVVPPVAEPLAAQPPMAPPATAITYTDVPVVPTYAPPVPPTAQPAATAPPAAAEPEQPTTVA